MKPFGIFLPAFDENYFYFTTSNVTSDFMVDPEFLYSLAGKIGANVSKNINLRAYAPSEIFPLLAKNLFTGNIFIDNYPRIDKSYILYLN